MRRQPVLAEAPVLALDTCPQMQELIERLVSKHQVDVTVADVRLWLVLPSTRERLLIAGLSDQRIGVTHCIADADEQLACDTDLVFLVDEVGWQPIELLHTAAVWAAYGQGMAATGTAQVPDSEGNFERAYFAEYWAEQLTQQRWLEAGQRLYV